MGGLGSTRWGQHQRKRTAEECLILDLRQLLRELRRLRQDRLKGTITWANRHDPEAPASCAFTLQMVEQGEAWLELHYEAGSTPVVCRIALICVSAFGGRHQGHQWLGICPRESCGRRVRKVFCRPDVPSFRCAICHDLTYVSRQTAHWHDRGGMAAVAKAMGMPLPLWKLALRRYVGTSPLLPSDGW
jgi:hypothetical protein